MGMAYTFAHLEIHSRKGGKSGSTSYVLDEAERLPGASPHVANPSPPQLVYGMPIAALRRLHDDRAEACQVTQSNGRTRKIRSTQNTLATVVMSFPEELASADPDAVRDWERRSVAWLEREYGRGLKTVVRHVDEKHPHLHAYLIDEGPEMRATSLHPGYQAQAEVLAAAADHKAGSRAYKEAMRQWQDRYWKDVGLPCGLARLGPGRRRLTRGEWQREQAAAKAVRTALKAGKHLRGKAEKMVADAHKDAAAAIAQADAVTSAARLDRDEARKDRQEARRALQAAEMARERGQRLGAALGAAWTVLRGWTSSRDRDLEKRIREEEEAKRRPLEDELERHRRDAARRRELQSQVAQLESFKSGPRVLGPDSHGVTWHPTSPRPKG